MQAYRAYIPLHYLITYKNVFLLLRMSSITQDVKTDSKIFVRTNFKGMCLSVKAVKLWNSLDNKLKSCSNINIFKKQPKFTYMEKYR